MPQILGENNPEALYLGGPGPTPPRPCSWHHASSVDLHHFVLHGLASLGGPQGTENTTTGFECTSTLNPQSTQQDKKN